jgi:hypothetical protein
MPRPKKVKPAEVSAAPATATVDVPTPVAVSTPPVETAVVTEPVVLTTEVPVVVEPPATTVETPTVSVPVVEPPVPPVVEVTVTEQAKSEVKPEVKYITLVDGDDKVRKFYAYFDTPTNRTKVERILNGKGIVVKQFT